MNFNDYPDELKNEEQKALNEVISKMDGILEELDQQMQNYVQEAKNADIAVNPDLYFARILAEQGKKDTQENRKKYLNARDELYKTRLLLKFEDEVTSGIEEIKVGLHSCLHRGEHYVVSWDMPLCRHYVLNNDSTEYDSCVTDGSGQEFRTHYSLLVKNELKLRFTHVISAMNMFPGIYNDEDIKELKGKGFFSDAFLDKMISRFDPKEYDPDSAAKIISDEFLQELLERRSTPEFKNIVFSIQKKQGEIIQAPYQKNMIVQGCAGSGKSMIMLHRLPILLYDHPDTLGTTNLYIITPSQMYIQLAENMRHQLEISDVRMGTIEEYYDYCISKYPGHTAAEYGKISWGGRLRKNDEKYVYSKECIGDIRGYLETECRTNGVSLEKAFGILKVKSTDNEREKHTYAQKVSVRLLEAQNVLDANRKILKKYFDSIQETRKAISRISNVLKNRKTDVVKEIQKLITSDRTEMDETKKELSGLDRQRNAVAIQRREQLIAERRDHIRKLVSEQRSVEADTEYFASLTELGKKIESIVAPFQNLENLAKKEEKDYYRAIYESGKLVNGYHMILQELLKMEDKYERYSPVNKDTTWAGKCVTKLQGINGRYLDYKYYLEIRAEEKKLKDVNANVVGKTYEKIMEKIGAKRTASGSVRAFRCSPYLYLQVLYQYQGSPAAGKESLLAIDEAQGFAPEEIRLLKNVNDGKVVFNMYGDIYQHIEGTKGVDSWKEFKGILDFEEEDLQENYRNASQITEYCNKKFGIKMKAINTPGKGVHEIKSDHEFQEEIVKQLLGARGDGLAAILVSDNAEARYLLDRFSDYEQKFHDMTGEEHSLHQTRWNIINIDEAKGLEFTSVIVLAGRMSRNQRYIAYTRAMDDLYVYEGVLDTTGFENKTRRKKEDVTDMSQTSKSKHAVAKTLKDHSDSKVRKFFEERGLEVIDNRDEGGRLWVIGEKEVIRDDVAAVISEFKISGKYAEIFGKKGWCTKTDE